jgi:hypothetical protein
MRELNQEALQAAAEGMHDATRSWPFRESTPAIQDAFIRDARNAITAYNDVMFRLKYHGEIEDL